MTALASPSRPDPALDAPPIRALGAILAGGASSRFGGIKALAAVGGTTIVERTRYAVAAAVTHPVLITHIGQIAEASGLPSRADASPVGGPLAGVATALLWAAELGLPGALCVACDLPFLPPALLRELVGEGIEGASLALVPESGGPAGVEPLCAWYSVRALPAVQRALGRGERRVTRLLDELGAVRFPIARVALHGDPSVIFLNVNTPAGRDEAERIAAREGALP
jgi:molybdopterin-guanine dinucleotide biosynthesis protein A